MYSFLPKPLSIPSGPLQIFLNITEIFAAQDAPPMLLTPVANGKNLQLENFNFFCLDTFG
jgi:hypothetical protein